ncbi:MAG: hypothetical protein COA43_12460 [Robiginitomaculum sp.]|nr:MAG: hypothetical protein COA43_12460 [Robiginitomaculum sp.]
MLNFPTLHTSPFLSVLPETLANKVKEIAVVVKYNDGEFIHDRGDMKRGLSIVKTGAVNVGVYGEDGAFILTSTLGEGQCFGEFTLFTKLPRTHHAAARGVTEIYQIPGKKFMGLTEKEPQILNALLTVTLMRTHYLIEMLDAFRRLPLRERTAKTLVTMMGPRGATGTKGGEYKISCRQSELASMLGVTRVSLNRVLQQLADLTLIKIGYGYIEILDTNCMISWVGRHCGLTALEG